jgi:CRP/FNR family cyclic AMP-dependent transcriptional regulator
MNANISRQSTLTEKSSSNDFVSRKLMRERAVELAALDGHCAQDVSKSDWEQAKRELTGEPGEHPKAAISEIGRPPSAGSGSTKTIENQLSNHPFLKGMEPDHLAIIARHAREVEFTAHQVVFHQNESAHELYLVLQGSVVLEAYVPRGENVALQALKEGDVLGWSWLFPPFVWNFQARALEPTRALFIDGAALLATCDKLQAFGLAFMRRVAQVIITRLEIAQKRLMSLQKNTGKLPFLDEPMPGTMTPRGMAHSLEDMLADHPFFKGMRSAHLRIVAGAAMKTHMETDQFIFREGDPANRLYLIQKGRVALEAPGTESTATRFEIIGAGDMLGWSWLFPPFYAHFAARALEPTEGIFLYGTRLREECEQNPEFGYDLMKRTVAVVIQRLQATRGRLVEIANLKNAGPANK